MDLALPEWRWLTWGAVAFAVAIVAGLLLIRRRPNRTAKTRRDRPHEMLPPWKKFDFPEGDLGWRMGAGEGYLDEFMKWWNSKSLEEKRRYAAEHPAPPDWEGFYPDDIVDRVQILISILLDTKELLSRPNNDFSWSHWKDAREALAEIDQFVTQVRQGVRPAGIETLFAATGPVCEVGTRSGWRKEYLMLAERFDMALAIFNGGQA